MLNYHCCCQNQYSYKDSQEKKKKYSQSLYYCSIKTYSQVFSVPRINPEYPENIWNLSIETINLDRKSKEQGYNAGLQLGIEMLSFLFLFIKHLKIFQNCTSRIVCTEWQWIFSKGKTKKISGFLKIIVGSKCKRTVLCVLLFQRDKEEEESC